MNKFMDKIKNFLSKKKNLYMVLGIVVILLIVIIVAIVTKRDKSGFALDTIYDVYPAEVRELYSNMVSVSCDGDLVLGISKDAGSIDITNIDQKVLLSYALSYLNKNKLIDKEFDKRVVDDAAARLFYGNVQLGKYIGGFTGNGYVYNVNENDDKVVREETECNSDKKYISDLFGYSYNKNELSIDVNMGYLVDDTLYDLDDNKLGKYDGNAASLRNLFSNSSHYRYTYVLERKIYKLKSVEWDSRI